MKLNYILVALLIGLFMASCGGDDPEPETCDTTNVTYTNGAAAIINATCATSPACHNNDASSTFKMSDYDQSFAAAGFNKIVGSINHTDGFSNMPKGADKLSQCDIDILTAWIDAGAPE